MSMYAEYLKERTQDLILETDCGFATYRYLNDGKTVYIVDIYTIPAARKTGHAFMLADQIVAEAKDKGAKELLGTVMPSARNSTISLKMLMAYHMVLSNAEHDCIVFRKDI